MEKKTFLMSSSFYLMQYFTEEFAEFTFTWMKWAYLKIRAFK